MGEVRLSNGPVLPFSAPAAIKGVEGVLTPEDAFVAALNTCYMLMFIWSVERLKIDLVSYTCEAEGHVEEFFDRTSTFDIWCFVRELWRGAAMRRGSVVRWSWLRSTASSGSP